MDRPGRIGSAHGARASIGAQDPRRSPRNTLLPARTKLRARRTPSPRPKCSPWGYRSPTNSD
jgi:hypothetical protein